MFLRSLASYIACPSMRMLPDDGCSRPAIARNVVEGLGGTIGIDSRVRTGTTVQIEIRTE